MTAAAAIAGALLRRGDRAESSDDRLISACLAGDQRAWNELVERYGRLVYSVARRYGLAESDADDVFQEVFTILYRKLGSIRDSSRLAGWLITTAHRESSRLGKQAGRYLVLKHDLADEGGSAPGQQAESGERHHQLRQALRQLGGRCEELLVALFSAPGRPDYEAIARRLDMKVGSIGPTRSRCFRKLERILAEQLPDGGSADGSRPWQPRLNGTTEPAESPGRRRATAPSKAAGAGTRGGRARITQ